MKLKATEPRRTFLEVKKHETFQRIILGLAFSLFLASHAAAQLPDWALEEPSSSEAQPQAIGSDDSPVAGSALFEPKNYSVEELKQQMLELNRDLLILEEELLFPSSTQVSVFLSMDVGQYFRLDSVRLEIDGKQVASHLYTQRQLDSLHRGGVQRLHLGNIKSGAHEIAAFFIGEGTHERDYKRAAAIEIEKSQQPLMLELVVRDSGPEIQPQFYFESWAL